MGVSTGYVYCVAPGVAPIMASTLYNFGRATVDSARAFSHHRPPAASGAPGPGAAPPGHASQLSLQQPAGVMDRNKSIFDSCLSTYPQLPITACTINACSMQPTNPPQQQGGQPCPPPPQPLPGASLQHQLPPVAAAGAHRGQCTLAGSWPYPTRSFSTGAQPHLALLGLQLRIKRTCLSLCRLLRGSAQLLLHSVVPTTGTVQHATCLTFAGPLCCCLATNPSALPNQTPPTPTSCFFWYRGARLRDSRSCTCSSSRLLDSYRSRALPSAATARSSAACTWKKHA